MAGRLTVDIGEDGDILVSLGALAQLPIVEATSRTISRWANDGLPYEMLGKRRLYPISKCLKWMIEHGKIDVAVETFDDFDREQMPPDLRDKLASAELKEFKLKKERGYYIEKDEVERQAYEIGKKVKENLRMISNRIGDELAAIDDPHEIKERLTNEISNVLEQLAGEISAI